MKEDSISPPANPTTSTTPGTEKRQPDPSRRSWLGWIIAFFAGGAALIAGVAALPGQIDSIRDLLRRGEVLILGNDFKLRQVLKVSQVPSGENSEVTIEAVAEIKSLGPCTSDLIVPGRSYSGIEKTPKEDAENGYKRFQFSLPKKDFPEEGKLRLRCGKLVSEAAAIEWPIEPHREIFNIVRSSKDDRGPSMGCGTDVEGWAKLNHPDVCKFVKVFARDVADGGGCGYTFFSVICSNAPIK